MTTKKPNRWERMVDDVDNDNGWIRAVDAIKLLRAQHKAVVRMIQAMQAESWSIKEGDVYVNGYQRATHDILDQLTERAK